MNPIQIDSDNYDVVRREIRVLELAALDATENFLANMECPEGTVEVRYSQTDQRREMVTVPCGEDSCDFCQLALAMANLKDKVDARVAFLTRTA